MIVEIVVEPAPSLTKEKALALNKEGVYRRQGGMYIPLLYDIDW